MPALALPSLLTMSLQLSTRLSLSGEIEQGIGAHLPEITAQFRDPAGNVFGLYQEPARAASTVK